MSYIIVNYSVNCTNFYFLTFSKLMHFFINFFKNFNLFRTTEKEKKRESKANSVILGSLLTSIRQKKKVIIFL